MNQTIKLDTRKREGAYGEARIAPLRRGERNNALLTVKICANGVPYDLSGKTASLVATTAAGKLVGPCPMEVAEAGIARIMLPAALYSAVGAFMGYVEIREGETLVDTTDSFGGKVIECADLDAEQAAEFTPLLGELQNAVAEEAKRVEAEKARAQAEIERETGFAEAKQASQAATEAANDAAAGARSAAGSASDAAESANTAAGKANDAAAKAESDVRAFVNAAGTAIGDAISGAKADVDAAVKRSDTATAKAEAAAKTADAANTAATQAVSDARDAIAEVKATEAKLYPAAENILVGSDSGTVAHVDDAFAGASLREITVEGATEQVTTTGKNLLDCYKLAEIASKYYAVENGNLKVIRPYNEAWSAVPAFITLDAGTYYSSGDKSLEIRKASDGSVVRYGEGRFVLDQNTEIKIKVGTGLPSYPVVINAQIEKGSTATAYEPYTGGKPSPSPEYQQPIAVIENPTVKIVGRNHARIAADMPRADCDTDFAATTKRIIPPGTYIEGLTFNNYLAPNNISELKIAEGSIGFDTTDQGYGVGVGVNMVNGATYIDSVANYHSFYDEDGTFLRYVYGRQFQVPDDAAYSVAVFRAGTDGHFSASNIAITHVADNGAYAPYTSQSLTFALPEEHPYLAKLPDGTADEIVVDEEGNVELVARVLRIKVPDGGFTWNIQEQPSGFSLGYTDHIPDLGDIKKNLDAAALMSERFESQRSWKNNPCFGVSEVLWVVPRTNQNDITSEDVEAVANGMVFYAPLATAVTYPLGKIEMPKAQDSIVNAWTDAEVTPNTGIKYVRDVNIVVANLESAIASITKG